MAKLALVFLALLGLSLVVKGVLYEREITRVEAKIKDTLGATTMSADQLYGSMDTGAVTRQLFEAALRKREDDHQFTHRDLELRAADGVYIKVRVYFVQ